MRLNEFGLVELVEILKRGEASPQDVALDLLSAIGEKDGGVHAYLDVYADALLAESKKLSDSVAYRATRFAGVPIAVKDNIARAGRRTTCASRMLETYVSPYDATVIERLKRDGALVCGATNLDEFAMGSSTENSAFGPTRNPYDLDRVPGGSSGGSAAAVASRTAVAALGSDTGGSIRQPASFCGVVGMKPTYGRVSRYGLVAFASSLDQVGPIARSVRDTAFILASICGKDPRDATSLDAGTGDIEAALEGGVWNGERAGLDRGLDGLTVGIPRDLLGSGLDPEVRENFETLAGRLSGEGVPVVDVALPACAHAVACYYVLADAEASANLARYDGVGYGRRSNDSGDLYAMYAKSRGEGLGDEVKRRILLGTYVLSAGYYDDYYLAAQRMRARIAADFERAFRSCDLILLPTAPSPAFRLGEKAGDPLAMYLCDVFTIPANLAGLPAVSVPSGVSPEGLPLGVQLIGAPMSDAVALRGAAGIERLADFREVPRV